MTRRRYLLLAWVRNLASVQAGAAVLSALGALWLVIEMSVFFFGHTSLPERVRELWWVFVLLGGGVAAIRCRPRSSIVHRLNGRDVAIEIAVGDVFSFPGALIVGGNTTFDTKISPKLISSRSVQGLFTGKYYSDEGQLDAELDAGLRHLTGKQLQGPREGKLLRYPLGTVVRVNPKGRTAYIVAIADINPHGVAKGSFEKLRASLASLWVFVGSRGAKEELVMPVLGTGFTRLPQTREEVIREIVRSFIAACSERVFADRLTIVISPRDVASYQVSLEDLGEFLQHLCLYTGFASGDGGEVGRPAPSSVEIS